MEIAILLFLLSANGRGGDLKKTLEDFLSFYRENRELLQMFLSPHKENPPQEKEKSQPQNDEVGSNDILGEFLKHSMA